LLANLPPGPLHEEDSHSILLSNTEGSSSHHSDASDFI
jgi:hypothetical protein